MIINNFVFNINENKYRKVYRYVLFIISNWFYIIEVLRIKFIFKGLLLNRYVIFLIIKSK